ncbi:MAG: AIPR family protein [bacterium]|nr:AIPR family protein [bacterium]
MRTYKIPVEQAHMRRIDDPNEPDTRYTIHINVRPLTCQRFTDGRGTAQTEPEIKVVREIDPTLDVQPEDFHLLTGVSPSCVMTRTFDPRSKTLVLPFDPAPGNGSSTSSIEQIDHGDDSYDITSYVGDQILELLTEGTPINCYFRKLHEQNLRVEGISSRLSFFGVIVGVEDVLALQLARARNTSAQVKDFALANLAGKFEWVKDLISTTDWAKKVAFTENEGTKADPKPIDIRDIIRIASAFHPDWTAETRIPMHSYTSPGKALEIFSTEEDQRRGAEGDESTKINGFKSLRPILKDIMNLYWEVKGTFEDVYREIGGETGVKRSKETGEELEVASGRGRGRAGRYEHFTAKNCPRFCWRRFGPNWLPPETFVMPIVAAFRSVTKFDTESSELQWKVNPLDLYKKNRQKYVAKIISSATELKKPNAEV